MKKAKGKTFFSGRTLPDHLTQMHKTQGDQNMTKASELTDFDRLYLSLAEEEFHVSFGALCFTHDIHSLNALESIDNKKLQKLRNLSPVAKEELKKLPKKAKKFDFTKLAEKHGKIDYKTELRTHGVPIISIQDIKVIRKVGAGPYSGAVNEAVWTKPDGSKEIVCLRYEHNIRQARSFLHEAKMLATFKHENVLTLYGAVVTGAYVNSIALVLEFAPHGNIIEALSLLTVGKFCRLLPQLISVLQHLHNKGLIHFGLSDAAVFVMTPEKIKISGFWGCHPKDNLTAIKASELHWLGNSSIRNKSDMIAWFAYFVERTCFFLERKRPLPINRKKNLTEGHHFSIFCPEVMYTLLERCSKAVHELGRPSFEEILSFLNSKNFPPMVQMTSSFKAKDVGDISFSKGESILLLSKNCTSKSHIPSENVWFGEKYDGKIGLFDSLQAQPLFTEDPPVAERQLSAVEDEQEPATEELSAQIPAEITARGPEAEDAYRKALFEGTVQVYRGRIMLIGQDRAGKTSLKKSLLGLPFDPEEPSTEGIEVDPSTFEINVDEVKNWRRTGHKRLVSEFADDIARIMVGELTKQVPEPAIAQGVCTNENVPDSSSPNSSSLGLNQELDVGEGDIRSEESNSDTQEEVSDKQCLVVEPADTQVTPDEVQIKIDDVVTVPEDVTNLVIQYLRNLDIQEYPESRETVVSIWDFAGQHLYYASHPVFLSPRAVYVLVYNLGKDLNAMAEPCVRQGVYDVLLENAEEQTNLEGILSWLVSIHNIQPGSDGQDGCGAQEGHGAQEGSSSTSDDSKDGSKKSQEGPKSQRNQDTKGSKFKGHSYLRPPVIIVGTNADHPFEDPKRMETHIKKSLSGKSYQQHVVKPFLVVNNTLSSADQGVQRLQKMISDVFQIEPYMGEHVPVRWFNFEKVVEALIKRTTHHLPLADLERIINKVCFIEENSEVAALLNFYHDLGLIVKHGGTVVLQSQWLIDLFKKLITIRPFDEQNPMFAKYWSELEESGILHMVLAEHVFSEYVDSGQSQEDILAMMEHYGLIAKFNIDGDSQDKRYFVPAQLSSSPEGLVDIEPSSSDPSAFYVHFQDGFVPHGLYSMLISKFISWCSKNRCRQEPNLYKNASRFIIGTAADYELALICRKRFIKIVVRSITTQDSAEEPAIAPPAKPAASIRSFVEQTLREMSRECPWLRNMRYEFCVICPSCLEAPKPCYKHKLPSCSDDDCLHLLPITTDRVLICRKCLGKGSRPKVEGLEVWYEADEEIAHSSPNEKHALKTGIVSHEDLVLLARDAGAQWKGLGRALDLDEVELEQIEAEETQLYEQCYSVLRRWTEIEASAATYESLGRALVHHKVERGDLAAKYCGVAGMCNQGITVKQQDITDAMAVPTIPLPATIPGPSAKLLPPVFLSYQWDMQQTALELGKRLREAGIECWMDVGQMGGGDSLYAQIDAGVRAAKVMLCCVTSKYCISENCQREATLADTIRKPIVPLLFEFIPWPPAGQLGPIFAKLLYIDMTQGTSSIPEMKFQELVQKLNCFLAK